MTPMPRVAGSAPVHRIICGLSNAAPTPRVITICSVRHYSRQAVGAQPRSANFHSSSEQVAAEACSATATTAPIASCHRSAQQRCKAVVSQTPAGQSASGFGAAAGSAAVHAAEQQQFHQSHKERVQPREAGKQQLSRPQLLPQQQQPRQTAQLLPLPGYPSAAVGPGRPTPRQQQQQTLLTHPFCTLEHHILTYRIKQCRDWHETAVLFAQQSQCMNHINCAALITHLAQLGTCIRTRPVNWRRFITQILAASEPQLNSCSPRQLSNMVWGLATLGFHDWASITNTWTLKWRDQLTLQLPQANCRDIANILWAVATSLSSSNRSSSGWLSGTGLQPLVLQQQQHVLSDGRLQQEVLSALHRELPNSKPQDVSNSLWALAILHLTPTPELQQYLIITAQSHSSALKPQEVAQALWAVTQLKIQPPTEWVRELLLKQVSHGISLGISHGVGYQAEGQSSVCGAVGDACGVQQVEEGVTWQLVSPGGGQQQQQQMVTGSAAEWQELPQRHALQDPAAVNQQQQQQQQQCRPERSSNSGRAPHTQGSPWQGAKAHQRQRQRQQHQRGLLSEPNPQNIVICLVACAQLKQLPPNKWLQQALARLDVLLLQNSSSTHASSHSSSSKGSNDSSCKQSKVAGQTAGRKNPAAISGVQGTANAVGGDSGSSSLAQDLANTIWALGSIGVKPHTPWVNRYLAASGSKLHTAKPQELCNMIWGLARLGIRPNSSWLQGFDAATSACIFGFSAQGLADLAASQVSLGLRPSGAWKETWIQGLKLVWGSADAPAMCKTLWAAARLHVPLGKFWLSQSLLQGHEELQRALINQELKHEELLRLVWAVGKLSHGTMQQSVSDMLGLHCCRAAAKMSWQQLQRAAQGLRKLRPLPRQQLVCYFCDLAEARMTYMPAEQGFSLGNCLQLLRVADERRQHQLQKQQLLQHVEQAWQQALKQKQQQQQQQQQQPCGLENEPLQLQQWQQHRQQEVAV